MQVKIKKVHPLAKTPTYGTSEAGCFDLYSAEPVHIDPDFPANLVTTGLAFEVPKGYVMLVFSRSGHGIRNDVRLANCVGVIDADFRGEVKVKLTRDFEGYLSAPAGARVAQALVIPYPKVEFVAVDELSTTERGDGGFGSTGS